MKRKIINLISGLTLALSANSCIHQTRNNNLTTQTPKFLEGWKHYYPEANKKFLEQQLKRKNLTSQDKKRIKNVYKRLIKTKDVNEIAILKKYGAMDNKTLIDTVNTLEDAKKYRDHYLKYKTDEELYGKEFHASLGKTHTMTYGDCDDYAFAIAGLLSNNGFKVKLLGLHYQASKKDEKNETHMITIYQSKENNQFGCIGSARGEDRPADYVTIEDLIKDLKTNQGENYQYYVVLDPKTKYENWTDTNENLIKLWNASTLKKIKK